MSQPDDKTRFITFYSYKGGVGRTMALANVACQLANLHGKHVICVDWDLEAPGLHYYFKFTDEELTTRAGLLDYLLDFQWQYEQGAKGKEPNIRKYLLELKPEQRDKIKYGSVRLLHCGQTGPNYMARVQAFDWDEYYEKYEGFRIIETLKKQLLDCDADMILVDARAGQADVGATPTIQVPDAVVLLFTSNTQNLEGTAKIARELSQHRMRKQLDKELKLLMVPARVFPREESFQRWLDEYAVPVFEKLVAEDVVSLRDQPKGLDQCMIPIDAKWAVPERLPILEAPTAAGDQRTPPINQAYVTLAQALENLYQGHEAWSAAPSTLDEFLADKPPDEAAEALRQLIPEAAARGDEQGVALLQFKLAQRCYELRRFDEAETNLQASLVYNERARNSRAISAIMYELGRVRTEQKKFPEAWSLFEKALALQDGAGDAREQGNALHEMGRVRLGQEKYDEAWSLFERALALDEEAGALRGQSVTLFEMAKVRFGQEEYNEAWTLFEKTLVLDEHAGDARGVGVTLLEMGRVRAKERKFPEAWSLFERALKLKEETGDARGQAIALNEMGSVCFGQEEYDEAWSLRERALVLCEKVSDTREQAVTLHEMGNIRLRQHQYDEAWLLFEKSLALCEEAGDAHGQGVTLHYMGRVRLGQQNIDQALALFRKALAMEEEAGDTQGQRATLYDMGRLNLGNRELILARKIFERGLDMAEANDDEEGVRRFRAGLANVETSEKEESDESDSPTKPAKKRKKKTARSSKKKS